MDVKNEAVRHAVFGAGKITRQNGNIITVAFPKPYGEKKFLFPDAFATHLTPCKASLKPEIEKELRARRIEIAAEHERIERAGKIARFRADAAAAKANKKTREKAKK